MSQSAALQPKPRTPGLLLVEIMYNNDERRTEVSRVPVPREWVRWDGDVPMQIVDGNGQVTDVAPLLSGDRPRFEVECVRHLPINLSEFATSFRTTGPDLYRPALLPQNQGTTDVIAPADEIKPRLSQRTLDNLAVSIMPGAPNPITIKDTKDDAVSQLWARQRWNNTIEPEKLDEAKARAEAAEERAHKAEAIVKMIANLPSYIDRRHLGDVMDAGQKAAEYLAALPLLPEHQAIVEKIADYYRKSGNGAGGLCHIVLDDHNIEDDHIDYCAKATADAGGADGAELMALLKPLPIWLRRRIVQADQ